MNDKPRAAGSRPGDGRRKARGDRVTAAYERLRDLILSGKLAPGSRIIETDLAERLEVSRTPVRSALQRLRQEGFITASDTSMQARLWVAPLTRADARELFAILSQCEGLAASWAAEKPESERRTLAIELNRLNDRMVEVGREAPAQPDDLFEIDREFHILFFDAGAGPRLKTLHEAVKPQAERYLRLYLNAIVQRLDESVTEHKAVVSAIDEGDIAGASTAVIANWQAASLRLDEVMARLGERGIW
jgi:DNA-binding GntR family transcriptional regulator